MNNCNPQEIISEFLQALQSHGIPPHDGDILADGKKHRYHIEGDKLGEKNGKYCLYIDEYPAGYFESYSAKHNTPYTTWSYSGNKTEYSEEERRRIREKSEQAIRQRTEKEAKERRYVAETAKKMWANATAEGVAEHPYIIRKGICNVSGLKLLGREIIVPLFDVDGAIHSAQKISADGAKKFLSGGRTHGCFCRLSGEGKYTFLCEGVATALSVRETTGCPCVIAFYAGNLSPVLEKLSAKIPNLVVASDNDIATQGNPGLNYAMESASERCIPVVVPKFDNPSDGTDFNDLIKLRGVELVCEDIHQQIEAYLSDTTKRAKFNFPNTIQSKDGKTVPLGTVENFSYLLRFYGYRIRYSEISHEAEMTIPNTKYGTDNQRNAALADIHSLMVHSGLRIPDKPLKSYIHKIADMNSYNSAQDFILREKWSGDDVFSALCDTFVFAPNTRSS